MRLTLSSSKVGRWLGQEVFGFEVVAANGRKSPLLALALPLAMRNWLSRGAYSIFISMGAGQPCSPLGLPITA